MTPGKFITLEGGEGVGKSTNLSFIQSWLKERQINVVVTREPGGTATGERIRGILLDDQSLSSIAELLLIFAARAQHIESVIRPALSNGYWVVSDRFTDASYAYQGGGRNVDRGFIELLEHHVQGELRPDLTLWLDAPIAIGMGRVAMRGASDRFEVENSAFFQRVQRAYLDQAARDPVRIKRIDASRDLGWVQASISSYLEPLCPHPD